MTIFRAERVPVSSCSENQIHMIVIDDIAGMMRLDVLEALLRSLNVLARLYGESFLATCSTTPCTLIDQ